MKNFILLIFVFLSSTSFSQVYGEIFMDKRAVLTDIDYTIPYSKKGKLVFDIRVNTDGKVTSCILNQEKSTITSTSAMIKAKNKIIGQLTFVKGVGLPEWHNGFVQINTVQLKEKTDNKFSPPN